MPKHGALLHGLILKRSQIKETDLLVTILSKEQGKLMVRAPGVRKLGSSMAAALEPGCYSKLWHIPTKAGGLVTQATVITPATAQTPSLEHFRQLAQFLELADALFVEEEVTDKVFAQLLSLQSHLCSAHKAHHIRDSLRTLVQSLGFTDPIETHPHVTAFVEELIGRPLKAHALLRVAT